MIAMNNGLQSSLSRRPVAGMFLNPFQYLAGGSALILGFAVMLLSGLIASFSHSHFNGVLDFHTWPRVTPPIFLFLAEGIIDWLLLSLFLFAIGKKLSSSRGLRMIDIFGTQALARAPHLLT